VRAWNLNQESSYPPFDNLRLTIQAAVELSQGREISRLDAKADVVNAFIRNAQDNLAAGKLADATQNVKDALAVAPNYGAAKVLQLMIKKQTDPAGFQRDATAQIDSYMKMGADPSNIEGQKTAYLALLDYSKLDPKFAAQTRGTIQELEYSLGLARRPPTAQQVAQSNALVQRANVAQQQGTPEAYQGALGLLKQALQINPENTDAVRLDGLIRTKMGSTALGALSPADTQGYNQAYSLFLSGAYQDSYDRVLAIWGDPRSPRNKTYGPLLRLKKRLEVQLNIS
jgi:tetratricopeptide (TPR) repeat protein